MDKFTYLLLTILLGCVIYLSLLKSESAVKHNALTFQTPITIPESPPSNVEDETNLQNIVTVITQKEKGPTSHGVMEIHTDLSDEEYEVADTDSFHDLPGALKPLPLTNKWKLCSNIDNSDETYAMCNAYEPSRFYKVEDFQKDQLSDLTNIQLLIALLVLA